MWFGVLGQLDVRDDAGMAIHVGGSLRRVLLAALLCRAGTTVPADALIEDLWAAQPPRTADKTLRSHVFRLRDDLGRSAGEVIATDDVGYRIDVAADELDAASFAAATEAGLAALHGGDDAAAIALLDRGLAWWRGDAYSDFSDAPYALGERVRLAGLRALALESRTDAALRLGQAPALIAELEQRVVRDPYRERSWEQLILALYRSGRQADALARYRTAQDLLAAELGVDPGPDLQELERQILRHDPALLESPEPAAAAPAATTAVLSPNACPYRGLEGYGNTDAALFVGRERLVAQVCGRLANPGLVVVTGASGSGKSSLLRAGVVPALRSGAIPAEPGTSAGSAAWRVDVRTPADAPAGEAEVYVVDQAEELLTVLDPTARARWLDQLRDAVDCGRRVVLVVRADFYGRLAELPWPARYTASAPVFVGPMGTDELHRVVVEPARRAGVEVDADVVDAILEDAGDQPLPLPLLSLALVRSWQHRAGNRITVGAYRAGGAVAGALEAAAESVYEGLDVARRADARRLLLRLAARAGPTWVRQPMVRRSDVTPGELEVLDALAAGRLVTLTEHRVELSHDALLERWPRLRSWLDERADAAALLEHLRTSTRAWLDGGRPATDVYRGPRLQAALDWQAEHPDDLTRDEDEFLAASAAAAQTDLLEARARAASQALGRRRLRRVVAGLAVALVVAASAAGLALTSRSAADRSAVAARLAALTADARRLAALSADAPDLTTSAQLAVAAYRLQDSSDTRGALLAALERGASERFRLSLGSQVHDLLASPDGTRLYALDDQPKIVVVDALRHTIVRSYAPATDRIVAVTASGRDLVVDTETGCGPGGELHVLDASNGRLIRTLDCTVTVGATPPSLAPGGRWLVADQSDNTFVPGRTIVVYDSQDWSRPARTLSLPEPVVELAAGRDVLAAETSDQTLYLIDAATLRVQGRVRRADLPTAAAAADGAHFALAPDGRHVAYSSPSDTVAHLLDASDLSGAGTAIAPQQQPVSMLSFSTDGTRLAVGTLGGAVSLYAADSGVQTSVLAGHAGAVTAAAWAPSPKGDELFTAGRDAQVVGWDVGGGDPRLQLRGADVPAAALALRFGDDVVGTWPSLTGTTPGTAARLFELNMASGAVRFWPAGLATPEIIAGISATPDGSYALVSTQNVLDATSRWDLWNLRTGTLVARIAPPSTADVRHYLLATISPDAHSAVVALGLDRLGVLALPSGRLERTIGVHFRDPPGDRLLLEPWEFDPHGNLIVVGHDLGPPPQSAGEAAGPPIDHRLGRVDLTTGKLTAQTDLGSAEVNDTAWSHDGTLLAVGAYSGALDEYSASTLRLVRAVAGAQSGPVSSVSFSPDDRTIVTAGTDAALGFWDAATLSREGSRIAATGASSPWYAWYDSSGTIAGLVTDPARSGAPQDRAFTFPGRAGDWASLDCTLAGGPLSRTDWTRYVGGRPYRATC